jgi:transcriptional regulator with XRE-family HTH domain
MEEFDTKLVSALREKRSEEGLSIRALSAKIGVSFSTLARIERGDGSPDNNSKIRLLEWLGSKADDAGLGFENVALVHFRAGKNAQSRTIKALLYAAECLKREYPAEVEANGPAVTGEPTPGGSSKEELELAAQRFRHDLGLKPSDSLDPLRLVVDGVRIERVTTSKCLEPDAKRRLVGEACSQWSAMSVPLTAVFDKWVVLLNDCHTIERQRVTLLEEYWHILSGHKLTKISKVADAYGRTYDSAEEHDAYYLASASLLPRTALINAVEQKRSTQEIAEQFGTSTELVDYRIKRLGLWSTHFGRRVTLS